jgi:predicted  nucleic acid-binding Zn-ribbon protein
MHQQLELLLQIQDLRSQRAALAEGDARLLEETEFHVDIDEAIAALDLKISEMENELAPPIRSRFRRISAERGRAVVPVINGICFGCFVSIPTFLLGDASRHNQIQYCDHCGRFLYVIG